ncbi:hypothetical protein HPO_02142 [Hyphomonas polymorpha PS728]|uniref:Uncharacterized protein n=2 Tax=Hyphomonadaceae TaxID=69657 RepID=A0A062VPG4_9PROT|nr:hypothetical protein BBF93_01430 [Hyphomonas sp. CACIAM 19H1]KDA00176.1 hypothetical protein HPO_02142 [Hyphomonas polymorpha PS728]
MLAVMFNSLLILLPVIGARAISNAYDQDLTSREGAAEALQHANVRLLEELTTFGPRDEDSKLPYWQDRIVAEMDGRNMSAVRGYLLAAPQMLGRDLGEQIRVRAEAEVTGTPDERLIRAALQKLPENVAMRIMETERYNPPAPQTPAALPGEADPAETQEPPPELAEAAEPAEAPETPEPAADAPIVLQANVRNEDERRFQILGSYADLAVMSQRWIEGDRSDELVLKLTGLGLVQQDYSDGLSDATALSVSILKSARRSQRLTPSFSDYLAEQVDAALPDAALEPALQEAFRDLATTEVRAERVRAAYGGSINQAGLGPLEADLDQIQRLAAQTSPGGALTVLAVIEDGTDLQRARLLAEAGGERLIVLVRERGREALKIADAGISWNRNTVLEIMSLTAAGMLLFWVMLSTVRLYIKLPKPRAEPQGA